MEMQEGWGGEGNECGYIQRCDNEKGLQHGTEGFTYGNWSRIEDESSGKGGWGL